LDITAQFRFSCVTNSITQHSSSILIESDLQLQPFQPLLVVITFLFTFFQLIFLELSLCCWRNFTWNRFPVKETFCWSIPCFPSLWRVLT